MNTKCHEDSWQHDTGARSKQFMWINMYVRIMWFSRHFKIQSNQRRKLCSQDFEVLSVYPFDSNPLFSFNLIVSHYALLWWFSLWLRPPCRVCMHNKESMLRAQGIWSIYNQRCWFNRSTGGTMFHLIAVDNLSLWLTTMWESDFFWASCLFCSFTTSSTLSVA